MAHATDIVAYDFGATTYCQSCIKLAVQAAHPADYPANSERTYWSAEQILDRLARVRGVNRNEETTFDNSEFPKVVLAVNANDGEWEHCDEALAGCPDPHIAHDESDCHTRFRSSA